MFEVDLSSSMGRHNFDDGATQLIYRGDTTPMLGQRNFGWGDITWGDKAMGRHNLHSYIAENVISSSEKRSKFLASGHSLLSHLLLWSRIKKL